MDLTLDQWISIGVGAASLLVAGGTFFLAWKTRDMARETKDVAIATVTEAEHVGRQAEATERQIELSRQQIELSRSALDASIRPWLTKPTKTPNSDGVTFAPLPDDENGRIVRIYLRNVGPGIALIRSGTDFRIEGRDRGGASVTRLGHAKYPAIPPGEETVVAFVLQRVDMESFFSQDRNDGEFYAWIPYTDSNGGQLVYARVHAAYSRMHSEWRFHKIDYFEADPEQNAFATVIFDAAVP